MYLISKKFVIQITPLLFIFLLPTIVHATGNKSITRGEPATIVWNVGGVATCDPSTNYPPAAGDGVYDTWAAAGNPASGTVTFPSVYGYSGSAFPQTWTFSCSNGPASDSATLIINDCNSGTTWNGTSCAPAPCTPITMSVSRTNPNGTVGENTHFSVTGSGATSIVVSGCAFAGPGSYMDYNGAIDPSFVTSSYQNCTWTATHPNMCAQITQSDPFQYCATNTTWNGSYCAANPQQPSGSISASNCTIGAGQSSCSSSVSWTTQNASTVDVLQESYGYISHSIAATVSATLPYGTKTFYLYGNSTLLQSTPATASCTSGTTWNGATCVNNLSDYDASCSIDSIGTVEPNATFSATVHATNLGANTWTGAAGYSLGSQDPQDASIFGTNRTAVSGSVATGGSTNFTVSLTAPNTPGTYTLQRKMVRDAVGGAWFGQTCTQTVTVATVPSGTPSITASCPAPGTAGTITVGPGSSVGATYFAYRINDYSTPWQPYTYPDIAADINNPSGGTVSLPQSVAGRGYQAWVHACNAQGCNYGVQASVEFTCIAPPTPLATLTTSNQCLTEGSTNASLSRSCTYSDQMHITRQIDGVQDEDWGASTVYNDTINFTLSPGAHRYTWNNVCTSSTTVQTGTASGYIDSLVSGMCGSRNNTNVSSQPTTSLCSAGSTGTATFNTNTHAWEWTCSGQAPSGSTCTLTNASCKACPTGSTVNGNSCSCPTGQEWSGQSCVVSLSGAPNVTASCPAPGNAGTITITPGTSAGMTRFAYRINDFSTPWDGQCTSPDACGYVGSSGGTVSLPQSVPNRSYEVWAHACTNTDCNWDAQGSTSFTCGVVPPPTATLTVPNQCLPAGSYTTLTKTCSAEANTMHITRQIDGVQDEDWGAAAIYNETIGFTVSPGAHRYTWNNQCVGDGGSASASAYIDSLIVGTCGSATSENLPSSPTPSSNLCATGAVSSLSYNSSSHVWSWNCVDQRPQASSCSLSAASCNSSSASSPTVTVTRTNPTGTVGTQTRVQVSVTNAGSATSLHLVCGASSNVFSNTDTAVPLTSGAYDSGSATIQSDWVGATSCTWSVTNPSTGLTGSDTDTFNFQVATPSATGDISAGTCTIAIGGSSCSSVITWSSSGVSSPAVSVTDFGTISGTNTANGTITVSGIPHSGATAFLLDGASTIDSVGIVPVCASGSTWNSTSGTCAADGSPTCSNGASNYPTCDNGGGGSCTNGANNSPTCTTCTSPLVWNAGLSSCTTCSGSSGLTNPSVQTCTGGNITCTNGAIDPPTCATCIFGQEMNGNRCETPVASVTASCPNGATNAPLCNSCPSGQIFNGVRCVALTGALCSITQPNVSFALATCGNGVVEAGEQCDGSTGIADADKQSCSGSCTITCTGAGTSPSCGVASYCSNGAVQTSAPTCATCPTGQTYSLGKCISSTCGNGVVEAGEQCDGGSSCTYACENTTSLTNNLPAYSLTCSFNTSYNITRTSSGASVQSGSYTGTPIDFQPSSQDTYSFTCGLSAPVLHTAVPYETPGSVGLAFTASPRTIKRNASATLNWSFTNPNCLCKIIAIPIITQATPKCDTACVIDRANEANRITTLLQKGTTDSSDPYGAGRSMLTALTNASGSKAQGKKTVQLKYSTIFISSCGLNPLNDLTAPKVKVQVADDIEG